MAALISSVGVLCLHPRFSIALLTQCSSDSSSTEKPTPLLQWDEAPPLADGVSVVGDFQRELMTPEGRQESLSSAWGCVPVQFEPVLLPLLCSCFTPLRWRTQNAGGQPGLSASPAEGPSLALCCSCCRSAVWMSPALEESSCVWGRSLHKKLLVQVHCESAEEYSQLALSLSQTYRTCLGLISFPVFSEIKKNTTVMTMEKNSGRTRDDWWFLLMLFAGTGVSREAFKLFLISSPGGLLLAEPRGLQASRFLLKEESSWLMKWPRYLFCCAGRECVPQREVPQCQMVRTTRGNRKYGSARERRWM